MCADFLTEAENAANGRFFQRIAVSVETVDPNQAI